MPSCKTTCCGSTTPSCSSLEQKLIHSPQHGRVQQQSHLPQYFVLYMGENVEHILPLFYDVCAGWLLHCFCPFSLLYSILSLPSCKISWLKLVCQMLSFLSYEMHRLIKFKLNTMLWYLSFIFFPLRFKTLFSIAFYAHRLQSHY